MILFPFSHFVISFPYFYELSGIRFSVPARFDSVEWAGLGPSEAYPDR